WGFEAFELMEHCEHAFFTGELRLWGEVLPAKEPAHVGGWGDGVGRGAQGAARDALKDPALAPLNVVVVGRPWVFEDTAHEEALHLHGQEGLEDFAGVEREALCEGVGG